MTNKGRDDEEWCEPQRDERGRYIKGHTGNWRGRPRKRRPEPWSLGRSLRDALAEEVPVTDGNGGPRLLEMRNLIVKSFVRALPKAKPKEVVHIFERLESLGAFDPAADDEPEEIFTEEDKKLLERVNRNLRENYCCKCDRPDFRRMDERRPLSGFKHG